MKDLYFMLGYLSKNATCEDTQCVQEHPAGLVDIDNSALDNEGNILDRPETAEGAPVNSEESKDD